MESKLAVAARRVRTQTVLVDAWAHIRTSQFWMVTIALFLRVGWIVVGHTYKFKSTEDNFGFGWEMGRIGAGVKMQEIAVFGERETLLRDFQPAFRSSSGASGASSSSQSNESALAV